MYHYINFQALTNPVVRFVRCSNGKIWDSVNSELSLIPTYADTAVALTENAYINGIPVTIPSGLPIGDYYMIFYDAASPENTDAFSSVFRIGWNGDVLMGLPIPMPLTLV